MDKTLMQSMYKLTIAIPVYERTEFFEEALLSAVNQSAPVNIIVVDNASSHDRFKEIIDNLNVDNVKYYRNETNLGMYGNWNRCIELCETEFVSIFGDDDILYDNYASSFYAALSEHPSIMFFHCAYERLYAGGKIERQKYNAPLGYHSGEGLLKNALESSLNINTNGLIFSKKLYPAFSFEFSKWAYNQDYLFAYSAFGDYMGFGVDDVLISIRVNPSGNALRVGVRAYLSTSLVYKAIKERFKSSQSALCEKAKQKEIWVLRNSIITGNDDLVEEMMAEYGNPFGENLRMLLKQDILSRIGITSTGFKKKIIITYMRLLRKLDKITG